MAYRGKTILAGLRPDDYVHPNDYAFRNQKGEERSLAERGLDVLADASLALFRRITEGRYVELTETSDPYLTGLLRSTCAILDYPHPPRLFVTHERGTNTSVGGSVSAAQILMPDYILQEYDEDMLYYILGNAVAMLKSGHVRLSTVCAVMVDSPVTKPFQLVLESWMRAADLSSDRGGLLACQSWPAAARCLMAEAGMPPREMRAMDDAEIAAVSEGFMLGADDACPNWMTEISGLWKKLNWSTTPPAERMRQLKAWLNGGYESLMCRWRKEESL